MGSCRARSVYLTTRLLGRLSPLSGGMSVQLAISLTDNRAFCSTTFTAAMLALVTEVLGLPGRVSSSTENFPALKALTHQKLCALKWSEVHIYHTIHYISALNLY